MNHERTLSLLATCLLFILHINSSVLCEDDINGSCQKDDVKCNDIIQLQELEESWIDTDGSNIKIFFIESSGRPHLSPRQACAAESAARFANVPVIVLLVATELDLGANNATKQLYTTYSERRVFFRHVSPLQTLTASPFGDTTSELLSRISESPKPIPHLSDALRLAVVHRFGGWYADIDTIFMKPLTDFETDVISTDAAFKAEGDNSPPETNKEGHEILGKTIANGIFRFAAAESSFLAECMERFKLSFRGGSWTSGGSKVMTPVLKKRCGIKPRVEGLMITVERYTAEKCDGIAVAHPKNFYPASWIQSGLLFTPPQPEAHWLDLVKDAYSIDFFQSSSNNTMPVLKRKYYGTDMPAYTALGPRYCPLAFDSQRLF